MCIRDRVIAVFYAPDILPVILCLGLAKAVEAISEIAHGLFQKHERMDLIAISMGLKGPLSLLALGVLVFATGSLLAGVAGMLLAWVAVSVLYDFPKARRLATASGHGIVPVWAFGRLKALLWLGLPMGVVLLLLSLNTNIPRYFIEHQLGKAELGIFAAMAYLMLVGNQIVSALCQSASPRLARYFASDMKREFLVLLMRMGAIALVLGLAGVVVAWFCGEPILAIMYNPQYATRTDVFILLMSAAAIQYLTTCLGTAITSARQFRPQPYVTSASVLTCLILCVWLVPTGHMRGAAWAVCGAALMQALGCLWILWTCLGKPGKLKVA